MCELLSGSYLYYLSSGLSQFATLHSPNFLITSPGTGCLKMFVYIDDAAGGVKVTITNNSVVDTLMEVQNIGQHEWVLVEANVTFPFQGRFTFTAWNTDQVDVAEIGIDDIMLSDTVCSQPGAIETQYSIYCYLVTISLPHSP